LQGRYHTHTEKERSPYKIAITASQIDLDRLATQMGGEAGKSTGSLSGQFEVLGDLLEPGHPDGVGRADVRDAQFHQLDLFQNIGQVLGMRELSDLRVRDGHTDLRLNGDKILIDKLTLNTSDLQLGAHGWAKLDKHLKLDAQLSLEEGVAHRLPGMIRDSFTPIEGGRRAIDFAVTGTTDKPKTNLLDKLIGQKINTQFGDVLGTIFGDKKADKERKKKESDKDKAPSETPAPAPAAPPAESPQPQPAAQNP
jgi:hypothetical protein